MQNYTKVYQFELESHPWSVMCQGNKLLLECRNPSSQEVKLLILNENKLYKLPYYYEWWFQPVAWTKNILITKKYSQDELGDSHHYFLLDLQTGKYKYLNNYKLLGAVNREVWLEKQSGSVLKYSFEKDIFDVVEAKTDFEDNSELKHATLYHEGGEYREKIDQFLSSKLDLKVEGPIEYLEFDGGFALLHSVWKEDDVEKQFIMFKDNGEILEEKIISKGNEEQYFAFFVFEGYLHTIYDHKITAYEVN